MSAAPIVISTEQCKALARRIVVRTESPRQPPVRGLSRVVVNAGPAPRMCDDRQMTLPDLDYAYLAEFASVQEGRLTAVGASFTYYRVPALPVIMSFAVAGRVRAAAGSGPVDLGLALLWPGMEAEVRIDMPLDTFPAERPYQDKVGRMFAATMQVPISEAGLVKVRVFIEGSVVRELAFEAEVGPTT